MGGLGVCRKRLQELDEALEREGGCSWVLCWGSHFLSTKGQEQVFRAMYRQGFSFRSVPYTTGHLIMTDCISVVPSLAPVTWEHLKDTDPWDLP